jgi:hypothetical protein
MLIAHAIDLGLDPNGDPPLKRLRAAARGLWHGRLASWRARPQTEMIFTMLPADGGSLLPHTDDPAKLVNLAVTMVGPGEWDAALGGGTDVNRPKDIRRLFNRTNARLAFDDVEVLDTIPFRPNQALVVIRTDSSWHSIRPMSAAGSPRMRKTVNINILASGA